MASAKGRQVQPRARSGHRDIRPGVGAVVRDDAGRVLLHRRTVGRGWAPISGHVEPGETLHRALAREIAEEANLTAGPPRLVAVYSDPAYQVVAYPDGRRVHFVTAVFTCTVTGGTLRGSAEGTAWQWFPPDRLPDPLLPYARIWLRDALHPSEHVHVH